MERILKAWAGLASHFIGSCFDIAKPYIDKDNDEIDPYVRFVSTQLFIDCHLSSESSLILVGAGKAWDADIINRSIMEGTIKYVFLMLGEPDEIKMKAREFWEMLPNYASIRRHDRAKGLLKAIQNSNNSEWIPLKRLLLTDNQIKQLRNGTNRMDRKRLEHKWSFIEITKGFSSSGIRGLELLVHLAHGYGMSSHLIHKDGDGVGMVWERYGRSEEEQVAVHLAHCARIASDICTFSKLRLHQLLLFCKKETAVITELDKSYESFFGDLKKAGENFTNVEYKEELNL